MVFKNLCILVLWTKLASALKGFTHLCLEISNIYVVWTFYTYENNFGINPKFTKYLKESCKLEMMNISLSNIFVKIAFVNEVSPNQFGGFGLDRYE